MRHAFLVTYDICDPTRLRKVYRAMLGHGDHLQLSVFRCELNPSELLEMKAELAKLIHHSEDQVLIARLGPVDGRGESAIDSIGKAFVDPERLAVVI